MPIDKIDITDIILWMFSEVTRSRWRYSCGLGTPGLGTPGLGTPRSIKETQASQQPITQDQPTLHFHQVIFKRPSKVGI